MPFLPIAPFSTIETSVRFYESLSLNFHGMFLNPVINWSKIRIVIYFILNFFDLEHFANHFLYNKTVGCVEIPVQS